MSLIKLNLGAGRRTFDGWINCDVTDGPGIQAVFDACQSWPFDSNSVGMIFANHTLEHLPDPAAFFKEAHRALVPGGHLEVTMPYGNSNEAWADPTHVRPWVPSSFCWLQPGWFEECLNPQHVDWNAFFGVEMCMRQVNTSLRWLMRKPLRHLGIRITPHLWDAYTGLMVGMVALKTPEAVAAWREKHMPQYITTHDFMYRHNYEGRDLRPGEKKEMVFFAERSEF